MGGGQPIPTDGRSGAGAGAGAGAGSAAAAASTSASASAASSAAAGGGGGGGGTPADASTASAGASAGASASSAGPGGGGAAAAASGSGAAAAPPASRKACLDDFVLLQTVGRGSFGKVIMVRHKVDQRIYAMKSLKKEQVLKRKQYEHTVAERRILENLEHPFIVSLRFAFQTEHKCVQGALPPGGRRRCRATAPSPSRPAPLTLSPPSPLALLFSSTCPLPPSQALHGV